VKNGGGIMFCKNCGKDIPAQAEFCTGCGVKPGTGKSFCFSCGAPTSELAEICVKCGVRLNNAAQAAPGAHAAVGGVSPKTKVVTALLAFFLGQLGIHRFYTGKTGTAIAMLVMAIVGYATMAIVVGIFIIIALGIWNLIDFIMILMGKFKDKNGLLITN
jgi:TM2 domain-containing membrane protein YozV/ribosomal protein L40E